MTIVNDIRSKQNGNIISISFRKRNFKKFSGEAKKKILKNFSKDEKLIYAFFLDIS